MFQAGFRVTRGGMRKPDFCGRVARLNRVTVYVPVACLTAENAEEAPTVRPHTPTSNDAGRCVDAQDRAQDGDTGWLGAGLEAPVG